VESVFVEFELRYKVTFGCLGEGLVNAVAPIGPSTFRVLIRTNNLLHDAIVLIDLLRHIIDGCEPIRQVLCEEISARRKHQGRQEAHHRCRSSRYRRGEGNNRAAQDPKLRRERDSASSHSLHATLESYNPPDNTGE